MTTAGRFRCQLGLTTSDCWQDCEKYAWGCSSAVLCFQTFDATQTYCDSEFVVDASCRYIQSTAEHELVCVCLMSGPVVMTCCNYTCQMNLCSKMLLYLSLLHVQLMYCMMTTPNCKPTHVRYTNCFQVLPVHVALCTRL